LRGKCKYCGGKTNLGICTKVSCQINAIADRPVYPLLPRKKQIALKRVTRNVENWMKEMDKKLYGK
jgi:hypothetical protein